MAQPMQVPQQAAPQKPKQKTLICNAPNIYFRKKPTLEAKDMVRMMPIGVEYAIVREVKSAIYGRFYQLANGYYVLKEGNYIVKE